MKYYALAVLAAATLACADSKETDLLPFGQIRAGYLLLDPDTQTKEEAFAIGGHFGLKKAFLEGLSVGAAIYTSNSLGLNQSNPEKVNPNFFDANNHGFTILGEAYVQGVFNNTLFKVGRQRIETPHADSDDIRMVPNLFEAVRIENKDLADTTLIAIAITKMAGWENGVDAKRFVRIDETLGFDEKTQGALVLGLSYKGLDNTNVALWNYSIDEALNLFYTEITRSETVDITGVELGVQFARQNETGRALMGEFEAYVIGARVLATLGQSGLTLGVAHNRTWGKNNALNGFGGGPYFTSMEENTIEMSGENARATTIWGEYDLEKIGLGQTALNYAFGDFKAKESENNSIWEHDIVFSYEAAKNFTFEAALALLDDKTAAGEDATLLRITINYDF